VILVDTSGLLSAIDSSQQQHSRAVRVLRESEGPFVISPFVLAELDYLLNTRVSAAAARALLAEVASGAYQLASMTGSDIAAAMEVIDRYADQALGLADASIVVLAERYGTLDLLTLDERRFRVVQGPGNRPFRVLPADR
jgi:uncharacterized protein